MALKTRQPSSSLPITLQNKNENGTSKDDSKGHAPPLDSSRPPSASARFRLLSRRKSWVYILLVIALVGLVIFEEMLLSHQLPVNVSSNSHNLLDVSSLFLTNHQLAHNVNLLEGQGDEWDNAPKAKTQSFAEYQAHWNQQHPKLKKPSTQQDDKKQLQVGQTIAKQLGDTRGASELDGIEIVDEEIPNSILKNNNNNTNNNKANTDADISHPSLPILAMGLPQAGSFNLFDFFHRCGLDTQHFYCCGPQMALEPRHSDMPMATCMLQNIAKQLPIFQDCGNDHYQVLAEMNGPRKMSAPIEGTRGVLEDDGHYNFANHGPRLFLPQYFHLDQIHAQYPNATFVLQQRRNVTQWVTSVMNLLGSTSTSSGTEWNPSLAMQLVNEFAAHNESEPLPTTKSTASAGTAALNRTVVEELLTKIYVKHYQKVRDFAHLHPSHKLIEVNVDDPNAGTFLAESMDLDPGCWSSKAVVKYPAMNLAFIIPVRDSLLDGPSQGNGRRQDNLQQWLEYMRDYLPADVIAKSHVYVVEQTQDGIFNKGLLFNSGFDYIDNIGGYEYMILDDVDQIPTEKQDPEIYYFHPQPAKLMGETTRKVARNATEEKRKLSPSNLGGALMMTPHTYKRVNGFSNNCGGWGGQEDNMAKRIKRFERRYILLGGKFRELYHERVHGLDSSDEQKSNCADRKDLDSGLSDLEFRLVNVTQSAVRGWNVTRLLVQTLNKPEPLNLTAKSSGKDLHGAKSSSRDLHVDAGRDGEGPSNKCDALFSMDSVLPVDNTACVAHYYMGWLSCRIGNLTVNTSNIEGSIGGEDIQSVSGREEQEEKLDFKHGAFTAEMEVPKYALTKMNVMMQSILGSISHGNATEQSSTPAAPGPTLLVKRDDYSNPCMTIATMYSTFMVMRKFNATSARIVWLDGHARSNLDSVWTSLFGSDSHHVKELTPNEVLKDVIVVNTMNAFGDEGMKKHKWGNACSPNSSLHQFRDFVLKRLGVIRSTSDNKKITLLVRKDHVGHPRSKGVTDRKLANPADDIAFIQSNFPEYTIEAVSFEDMPFALQLQQIATTDILMAVHGAGNVNSIFLPDHAEFQEFFPPRFANQTRFQYLSQSIGIKYVRHTAYVVDQSDDETITVRLRPPERKD
jgi:hypothetical protein